MDDETADADSGTPARDTRCRNRNGRRESGLPTAADPSAPSHESPHACPRIPRQFLVAWGPTPTPDALAAFFTARGDPTPARLARALRSLKPRAPRSRVTFNGRPASTILRSGRPRLLGAL